LVQAHGVTVPATLKSSASTPALKKPTTSNTPNHKSTNDLLAPLLKAAHANIPAPMVLTSVLAPGSIKSSNLDNSNKPSTTLNKKQTTAKQEKSGEIDVTSAVDAIIAKSQRRAK
jgi:hypothetical protein